MDDAFLVLGDLTAREEGDYVDRSRRLIVRMFVGDKTYDEEIEVESTDELLPMVEKRMAALAKKPDQALEVEAARPEIDPGHAVALPEVPE